MLAQISMTLTEIEHGHAVRPNMRLNHQTVNPAMTFSMLSMFCVFFVLTPIMLLLEKNGYK